MGIVVKTSSSYNNQSQGLIERRVSIFKEQLKKGKQTGFEGLRGIIKEVRINERGTICSYLVQLENGLITSRHRRCLKRDLPINDEMVVENEEPQVGNIPAAADIDDRAPPDLAPRQGHSMQIRSKNKQANHRANHAMQ